MMFSDKDILYDNLLDRLGGRDMLELMIDAQNFDYVYYNKQGLRFNFRSPGEERLRQAEFVPMAAGSTSMAYYSPPTYQVRVIVRVLNGDSWNVVKPFHVVTAEHPDRLANLFQTLTHTTITFP